MVETLLTMKKLLRKVLLTLLWVGVILAASASLNERMFEAVGSKDTVVVVLTVVITFLIALTCWLYEGQW